LTAVLKLDNASSGYGKKNLGVFFMPHSVVVVAAELMSEK